MIRSRLLLSLLALLVIAVATLAPRAGTGGGGGDVYTVRLAEGLADGAVSGRLILFFITDPSPRWRGRAPAEGPFYERPQPIFSLAVENVQPGGTITVPGSTRGFPALLDDLDGPVRVQAILDRDTTERSHDAGPGNLYSEPLAVELSAGGADLVSIELSRRVEAPQPPRENRHLKWVRLRSEMLSAFYGRDIEHRAGVALPKGYLADDAADRRWPVVLVIPGFGGRDDLAWDYASMHAARGTEDEAPQAVHVVVDPEAPLGHHGFVDSPNNGPRGTALVKELIPHLKERFRLLEGPEDWIVTGHSSGAWSALWLQLQWPDVFGGCWASAPDPIDFTAFQMTDLYCDENLYVSEDGSDTPSYREQVGPGREVVRMTVRQEGLMEWAVHPLGASGQQWDAWEAMFSPRDEASGRPRPLFDPLTGRIDRALVAEHWKAFDVARLVSEDWERYGPIVTQRVRIICGSLDSYYLNRAVERFKALVDERNGAGGVARGADGTEGTGGGTGGPGYVELYEGATHGNLLTYIFDRWNREMREFLAE